MKKRLARKIYKYDHLRNFSPYEHEEPFGRYSKAQVRAAYRRPFKGLLSIRLPMFRIIEDNRLEDIVSVDDGAFLAAPQEL